MMAGFVCGLVLYGLFVLSRCAFRVEEGEVAVLTTFGAAVSTPEDPRRLRSYPPGLHGKLPWQKVVRVSMKEQNLDLSGEEGGRSAMAEDGTMLRFDSILRYAPVEAELKSFLFGMRSPLDHITGLFTCLLRNEIANFRIADANEPTGSKRPPAPLPATAAAPADFTKHAGSYALIRRERRLLNERIERFCQEQIGRHYGVRFNAVDLVDILPPDDLADALNGVMYAQADAETQLFRAQGDCQQRVLSAERGVDIARARAQAAETEVDTLGRFLAELDDRKVLRNYVERRRAEVLSESRAVFVKEEHS